MEEVAAKLSQGSDSPRLKVPSLFSPQGEHLFGSVKPGIPRTNCTVATVVLGGGIL